MDILLSLTVCIVFHFPDEDAVLLTSAGFVDELSSNFTISYNFDLQQLLGDLAGSGIPLEVEDVTAELDAAEDAVPL